MSLQETELQIWLDQRRKVWHALDYSFNSFVIVTGVVVLVSTIQLWNAARASHIRDKITDRMLYVVAPLYALYTLFTLIFTIVFSERGLPATITQTTYEGAILAMNLLLLLSYFAVAFALVLMSISRANWDIPGATVQPTNVPTQQYWQQPTQPYYGQQQHMQHYNAQPIGQLTYSYNGPQPVSYAPAPQPYATQVYTPHTEQESLEDPSKAAETIPGSPSRG